MEDVLNIVNKILLMFCGSHYYSSLIKIIIFLHKANDIWDLLRVSHMNFLTSTQCKTHIGILHTHRYKSIKITNCISGFGIMTGMEWMMFPLLLQLLQKEDANKSNQRFENIFNFPFPVTINYYNNNYVIFYIMESFIGIYMLYINVVVDVFFISVCYVMIAHYEMIKRAYENINTELISENNISKSII